MKLNSNSTARAKANKRKHLGWKNKAKLKQQNSWFETKAASGYAYAKARISLKAGADNGPGTDCGLESGFDSRIKQIARRLQP